MTKSIPSLLTGIKRYYENNYSVITRKDDKKHKFPLSRYITSSEDNKKKNNQNGLPMRGITSRTI